MKINRKNVKSERIFIILWGFIMHIILLWGVMDANFHSPIIPNLSQHLLPKGSPAKRILIFVADGLRYRTFKEHIPPYLNSVIQEYGTWGISHTRMPTESRPGNIAIVAGLYEDPSAIFKGWKENPVSFDSVFNQSRSSWLWGSPDIISLFTKGINNNHIHASSYPAHWQDFSKNQSIINRLDLWVFNQYWHWLKNTASSYKSENSIIFFFHLLACDTIGHAAKPQARDYVEAMLAVDYNIEKIVKETEYYFGEGTTSYIFTSDHGMTDWGSHGSGSTDETETPFVVWGAGIKKKSYFQNIEQADITPLISALIGISIPINNEGILPYEFLDLKYKKFIAQAFLSNAKQLSEQVKANRELAIGKSLANMYDKDIEFVKRLANVEHILLKGEFDLCINETKIVTRLAKDILTHYRQYQTKRFLICLMLMWIGWIILLFVHLSGVPRQIIQLGCYSWLLIANIFLIVVIIPLLIEYAIAGCKEWRLLAYGIISAISVWLAFRGIIKKAPSLEIYSNTPVIEFIGIIVLTMMMFIGLMYRWTFSISMMFTTGLQKFMFSRNASSNLIITGIALSMFPLLPVVGPDPRIYIVLITLGIVILFILKRQKIYTYNKIIEITRIIATSLMCLNVIDGRSWLSWSLLFSTPIVIWLYPKDWNQRMFGITVALLSPLALLSSSYEPIFFLTLAAHFQNWPIYEFLNKSIAKTKMFNLRNFSAAVFLMLYTLLCFFGTGNMASISSFDPSWTRHFVTVFSPYIMTTLILLKIIMPLILVGCLIRALSPDSTIFTAVLLLGDLLAIPLMFSVTTEGSWLDIGSAISRFVIAIVLPCLLVIVYYFTKPFSTFSLQDSVRFRTLKSHRFKI